MFTFPYITIVITKEPLVEPCFREEPYLGFLRPLQVLLYDLRSSHPLLVKDHYYGLPINSIHFHEDPDLVLSADSKIMKMWHKNSVSYCLHRPWSGYLGCTVFKTNTWIIFSLQGKMFSSIEPSTNINDVCVYPGSGKSSSFNMFTLWLSPALSPALSPEHWDCWGWVCLFSQCPWCDILSSFYLACTKHDLI